MHNEWMNVGMSLIQQLAGETLTSTQKRAQQAAHVNVVVGCEVSKFSICTGLLK